MLYFWNMCKIDKNISYFEGRKTFKMENSKQETIHVNVQRAGRPGNPIIYTHVVYDDKKYTVMKIQHHDHHVYALIDSEDFGKVKEHTWHYTANAYLSYTHRIDGNHKAVYLHNMIMEKLNHPGQGAKESIDHINRNGLDNRKENLRVISQSEQNINQGKKPRNIVKLPEECGITPDDRVFNLNIRP